MTQAKSAPKVGFWVILAKVGGKAFTVLLKLLKGLKVGKAGLAVASFGSYALLFSWQFAAVLLASLVIHEKGHLWAMERHGMKTKGMYLIPFLGAAAVAEGAFPSRKAEAHIALMGPLWGLGMAIATYTAYLATGIPLLAALAGWMGMLNLFNLLPIHPLDGGRLVKSVTWSLSGRLGMMILWGSCAAAFYVAWRYGFALFIYIGIIGMLEALGEWREVRKARERKEDRERALVALAAAIGTRADTEVVATKLVENVERIKRGEHADLPEETLRAAATNACSVSNDSLANGLENHLRDVAWNSRIERKGFRGKPRESTPRTDMGWTGEMQAAYLRSSEKGSAPPMSPRESLVWFFLYLALGAALGGIMMATSHVPAADAAFTVFRN